MRYLLRAVKYFIHVTVIMTAILAALMLTGLVSSDIGVAFRQGWKSVGYILLMFAGVSAVYPYFGYIRRSVALPGEAAALRDGILEVMKARGYVLENEDADHYTFRLASPTARLMRLWEDRITFTRELGGYSLEGPGKDLARIVNALQYRFRNE